MMNCEDVTPVIECVCNIPDGGWCEPHQVRKTAHWVELCQTRPAYRWAWNRCQGPGQDLARRTEQDERVALRGVGAELRRLLGCGQSRQLYTQLAQMEAMGLEECETRQAEIAKWLVGKKMNQQSANRLVGLAIQRARKNLRESEITHGH